MGGADNAQMAHDPSPVGVRLLVECTCAITAALSVAPMISIVGLFSFTYLIFYFAQVKVLNHFLMYM